MTTVTMELSLLDYQAAVFHSPARNKVFVKGRRAGGTEALCRKALQNAITNKNDTGLWVDTVHRNITRYIKRYFMPKLRGLVDWNNKPLWSFNAAEMTLSFWNGSYIDFGSAERSETLEGFGYKRIYVNEAGHILWNEDLYYETLMPMGIEGEGAEWYLNGAPKGKNLFYQMWQWCEEGKEDWCGVRATSYDNPLVNLELVEKFRELYPDKTFRQEFLAEFLDDGAYFQGIGAASIADEQTTAELGVQYVIGLDLAMTKDFTVAWVGRTDKREAIYTERYSRLLWEDQLFRLADLSKRYNGAWILVDATSMGGLIALEDIHNAGIPVQGFTFTAKSKTQLISALAVDIEQRRFTFFADGDTLQELRAFQIKRLKSGHDRLEAPDGMHDDCVIALALCNWAMGRPFDESISEVGTTPGIGATEGVY